MEHIPHGDEARDLHGKWISGGMEGDSPSTKQIRSDLKSMQNRYVSDRGAEKRQKDALGASRMGDEAARAGDHQAAWDHYYDASQGAKHSDRSFGASLYHQEQLST